MTLTQFIRFRMLKAAGISGFLQFSKLIQTMLETGLRLEQEAFLMGEIEG